MYDYKILARKIGLGLLCALAMIGIAHLLPASAQTGVYSAVGLILAAAGTAAVNDLKDFKDSQNTKGDQ